MKWASLVSLFLFLGGSVSPAYAARKDGEVGLNAVAGLPQLIGGELRSMGLENFDLGVGFGFFPINSIAKSKIKLKNVNLGPSFEIEPSASYSLTAVSSFVRWYPSGEGFFLALVGGVLMLRADFESKVKNKETGIEVPLEIKGKVSVDQWNVGLNLGYQLFIASNLFFDFALGAVYLPPASTEVEVQGALALILSIAAGSQFDAAKADLENTINSGIEEFKKKFRVLPVASVGIGFSF